MMTVELKMLCVLLFAAFASAEVTAMTDIDFDQFTGKWYRAGFATNAETFVKIPKAEMKMRTSMIVPTKDGHADFSYSQLMTDGSCFRKTVLMKKTEIPGRFVFSTNDGASDDGVLVMADGKFDDHCITHTTVTKDGKSKVIIELNSRTPIITDELEEKFRQFCLDISIPEENIVMLGKNGEC